MMNSSVTKPHKEILDAFENLYQAYRDAHSRPLPRFKKTSKRKKQAASPAAVSTSLPNLGDCSVEGALPLRAVSHQGSFSSGVFSLDSDVDVPPDKDDDCGKPRVADQALAERRSSNDGEDRRDTPSEAGSGFVCRHGDGEGPPEDGRREQAALVGAATAATAAVGGEKLGGYGILTDEDIMFMMHKPRIKKRRKKPPWQKRKLDLDDLWLKGQRRWSTCESGSVEGETVQLYLNRNLRCGKICLENYICAMRKSRKGRKRPNRDEKIGPGGRDTKTVTSAKSIPDEGTTGMQKTSTSGGRRKSRSEKKVVPSKEETTKSKVKNSKSKKQRSDSDSLMQASTSGRRSKKSVKNTKSRKKVGRNSDTDRKSGTDTSRSSRAGTKRSGANVGESLERVCGSERETEPSGDTDARRTDGGPRSESESEESLINFVSLTPKKSRKLSRRKRKERLSQLNSQSDVEKRSLGPGRRRDALLGGGGEGVLSSENSEWNDDLEPRVQPLFGSFPHCGGVWNSIVEESS